MIKQSLTVCFVLILNSAIRAQTLQNVVDNGNTVTSPVKFSGRADFGEEYDPTQYGTLQITRPVNQGKRYHLSFIRNGQMVYGMGFLENSDTFGIQPGGNNNSPYGLFMSTDAKVGINTHNPIGRLDVRGDVFVGNNNLVLGSTGSFIQIDQGSPIGDTYTQIRAFSNGGSALNNLILQSNGGNVGIGTTSPDSKLSVKGKIRAQEVKVENANWPDYVFAKEYQLPSLQETEKHIKDKGHLPGIPSAGEVKANGIDLGEMNAKLLQKIEELTLHLIDNEKRNDLLSKQVQELKDVNSKILRMLNLKHEK